MANMNYCRFQNTEIDLQDCLEHLNDEDIKEDEWFARKRLIEICKKIIEKSLIWRINNAIQIPNR